MAKSYIRKCHRKRYLWPILILSPEEPTASAHAALRIRALPHIASNDKK